MKRLVLIAALACAVAPAAAQAQLRLPGGAFELAQRDGRRGGGHAPEERRGQTISMSEAIAIARARTPGRVLDAGTAGTNYRIRLLTNDGRVIDYIIDAGSGAILRGG